MNRGIFLILITLLITAASCSSRKSKLDRNGLIPEKELVSVLTDIHIADGLLTIPKITSWYTSLDSTSTYVKVIESHGYTKEAMDKTMKYYFVKNPKKLITIYDRVLATLSEMELRVKEVEVSPDKASAGFWQGKSKYYFPDMGGTSSTIFDITLRPSSVYTLSFTATFFPDDQSANPGASVYSCRTDSIETGTRNYIKTLSYIKDGHPHKYNITLYTTDPDQLHFRGWLYDSENDNNGDGRHATIEDISISFSSALK
ncbi:MAG TPA: DUF4296 domain-containing protein [Bacteroidales bacterium]|nr:DUF4296 domain-containing protein [Bacteroidales bacterium]HPT20387.1 DUF4296 domain-containing protein [Bacteroidales bacterium]